MYHIKTLLPSLVILAVIQIMLSAPASAQGTGSKSSSKQSTEDLRSLYILGGELSNSAASSISDIDEVIPRMKQLGLNTVLVPAYWDLIEPVEGQYDFSLTDRVIQRAREHDLHIVFLWFGVWKNSMSCYAPLWFKENTSKYPRAMTREGKPLEIASAFSEEVFQADCRVFTKFMQHLSAIDKGIGTVSMIQIENEIGMLEEARDHSPLAEKAFNRVIPQQIRKVLGIREAKTWKEVNTDDPYWDEQFMAYHYACYVERLAQVARSVYDIPLYVNAAMNSRGRKPGEYPSAGPLAHLARIWKTAAPSIDMLSPDIYDTGFKSWAAQYALSDNPLFIPESRCCENSGVRALYTFGEYKAVGFSPFAIDQAPAKETRHITEAYHLLRQLKPLFLNNKRGKNTWGLLFDQEDKERIIEDESLTLVCRHFFTLPWDPRATDGSIWPEGGAMIMKLAPLEYLIAGSGVVVEFKTATERKMEQQRQLGEDGFIIGNTSSEDNSSTVKTPTKDIKSSSFKGKRCGIGFVDQVTISKDGDLQYVRRDNGDQDHQGRHARISVGEYKILHVKLYEY